MTAKRVLTSRLLLALASSLATALPAQCAAANFYVSLTGNDANPGTKAKPFGTLERAREEIRKLKANGPLKEPATVFVRAGQYRMTRTLQLTSEDSGTERFPVTWQAMRGEEVRFIGGVRLTGFKPVSKPAILERLAPAARGQVLELDLKAAGVTDLGQGHLRWRLGGRPDLQRAVYDPGAVSQPRRLAAHRWLFPKAGQSTNSRKSCTTDGSPTTATGRQAGRT